MQNIEKWIPTKFVLKSGILRATKDSTYINPGSQLVADLVAAHYSRAIPAFCKGRLLDLGCGASPFFVLYKDHVIDSTHIDWKHHDFFESHIDFVSDLTQPLPVADEIFDTVLLSDVLEHLPEPLLLLQDIRRTLKDDGHLVLNTPFIYLVHEEPHDYYRYTEFALRYLIKAAGLEVVEIQTVGGFLEVLVDMHSKAISRIPLIGGPIARLLQSVTFFISKTRIGRRLAENSSRKFTLGYHMVAKKSS